MSEDWLYVGLAPPDVFQRLHDGLRKILKTDDNFIEAYLEAVSYTHLTLPTN